MATYAQRPAPSGLHAKYLRELSAARSAVFHIVQHSGTPNHIAVLRTGDGRVWTGHRDAMPGHYRGASDPDNLLTRPASD